MAKPRTLSPKGTLFLSGAERRKKRKIVWNHKL